MTEDGVDLIGIGTAPSRAAPRLRRHSATVRRSSRLSTRPKLALRESRRCPPRSRRARARAQPTGSCGQTGVATPTLPRDRRAKAVASRLTAKCCTGAAQYVVDDMTHPRSAGMAGVRLEARFTSSPRPSRRRRTHKCANDATSVATRARIARLSRGVGRREGARRRLRRYRRRPGDIMVYSTRDRATSMLPLARHVTNDIATVRRRPRLGEKSAQYGCAWRASRNGEHGGRRSRPRPARAAAP